MGTSGSDGALVAIGIVVFLVAVGCAVGLACKLIAQRRRLESSELREPLVTREASNGRAACKLCGYETFQQTSVCSGCSEPTARAKDSAVTLNAAVTIIAAAIASSNEAPLEVTATASAPASAHDAVQIMCVGGGEGTQRLKRVRRRNEWTRRVDATGRLVWHRDRSDCVDWRFPGYALLFLEQPQLASKCENECECECEPEDEPDPELASEITVVVHSTESASPAAALATSVPSSAAASPSTSAAATSNAPDDPTAAAALAPPPRTAAAAPTLPTMMTMPECMQELVSLLRSTRLEVVDASMADPRLLPLARASNAALQWHEALAMSVQAFATKYAHFVAATAALVASTECETLQLNVRRARLLEDSLEALGGLLTASVRTPVRVHFVDEAGVDAGGLQREWFELLNERLADPASGVFRRTSEREQTLYLDAHSRQVIGEHHLTHCFAAGRLIGRALLEGLALSFHLALPLLKIMLGLPVSFSDLALLDPELHRNLLWIMDNDGVDALGLSFSVTEQRGDGDGEGDGEGVVVDLVPGGHSIDLTDDNKDEYLDRRFRYALFESVASQLVVFLKGFYEVVPQELLVVFDADELDYLLCDSNEMDKLGEIVTDGGEKR